MRKILVEHIPRCDDNFPVYREGVTDARLPGKAAKVSYK